MAEKLTPQQYAAVTDRGGKLLVSAAAGSGKTKVLVDRLISYLKDPVNPANLDDFLIITYTKAAAAELRGKIAAKLSEHMAAEPENRHLQRQMHRIAASLQGNNVVSYYLCLKFYKLCKHKYNIFPDNSCHILTLMLQMVHSGALCPRMATVPGINPSPEGTLSPNGNGSREGWVHKKTPKASG